MTSFDSRQGTCLSCLINWTYFILKRHLMPHSTNPLWHFSQCSDGRNLHKQMSYEILTELVSYLVSLTEFTVSLLFKIFSNLIKNPRLPTLISNANAGILLPAGVNQSFKGPTTNLSPLQLTSNHSLVKASNPNSQRI